MPSEYQLVMQTSVDTEEVQPKEVAEEKYTTVDKPSEMQISGDVEEFKIKNVAEEKILALKLLTVVRRQS